MSYASNTSVSPEKSQEEIKRTLRRYGADGFGTFEQGDMALVVFQHKGLTIRIQVQIPDRTDAEFTCTPTGKERSTDQAAKAWEKVVKQRWRALLLAIKAKLEAVEVGISTIEQEFMPFVVMGDGRTFGEHAIPQLEEYAQSGKAPKLLLLGSGGGS